MWQIVIRLTNDEEFYLDAEGRKSFTGPRYFESFAIAREIASRYYRRCDASLIRRVMIERV